MAKKKKQADKADSVDLDKTSAEDAPEQDQAPVVPDGDGAAPAKTGGSADRAGSQGASEYRFWPVEDDHGSITRLLTGAADKEVDIEDYDHDAAAGGGSTTLNLVLMLLIMAATGVGIWQLVKVSSPETLAAKSEARKALEEAHLAEQLAKQKKYGVLRIESEPPQAVVIKDGEKLVAEVAAATAPPEDDAPADGKAPEAPADGKDAKGTPKAPEKAPETPTAPPADGKAEAPPTDGAATTKVGMTPMNIMNLDISKTYTIRLEKDGYEPFEFSIAEHLWTKDPTTGEYKFFKPVELTPINCEYWFLYNAKKRREVKFEQKADCFTHYEESLSQQVSVTECVCKIPPEGVNPEKAPE